MSEPDEERFHIDAVCTTWDVQYLTLECILCPWIIELEPPMPLTELNRRAAEHEQVCP